jgi:hypothetical protein
VVRVKLLHPVGQRKGSALSARKKEDDETKKRKK